MKNTEIVIDYSTLSPETRSHIYSQALAEEEKKKRRRFFASKKKRKPFKICYTRDGQELKFYDKYEYYAYLGSVH